MSEKNAGYLRDASLFVGLVVGDIVAALLTRRQAGNGEAQRPTPSPAVEQTAQEGKVAPQANSPLPGNAPH